MGKKHFNERAAFYSFVIAFVSLLSIPFGCMKETDRLFGLTNKSFPGGPILLFHIINSDVRVISNIEKLYGYLEAHSLPINIGVLASRQLRFGYEKIKVSKKIFKDKILHNSYILYNSNGKAEFSGTFYDQTGISQLVKLINKKYLPDGNGLQEYLKVGQSIARDPLLGFIASNYAHDHRDKYIVLFNEICNGCPSGEALFVFDQFHNKYPINKYVYVVMGDYTIDNIQTIKNNNSIAIDIIKPDEVASKEVIEWLENQTKVEERK